jgi:hypothetical protein
LLILITKVHDENRRKRLVFFPLFTIPALMLVPPLARFAKGRIGVDLMRLIRGTERREAEQPRRSSGR